MPRTTHNPIVVVPTRLGAGRLPGKPLLDIAGEPLIVHAWRRAVAAQIGPVVVAAAEVEIVAAIEGAGGRAVLTDPALPTGSDRVAAAIRMLDPERRHDVVVNLQGDMPGIGPKTVAAVLEPLADDAVDIATVAAPLGPDGMHDRHVVKVATDARQPGACGRAWEFSRDPPPAPLLRHIGIYAFRRVALERFAALPRGVAEQRESLEQLRALEHGMRIDVCVVDDSTVSVDTADSLEAARRALAGHRAADR